MKCDLCEFSSNEIYNFCPNCGNSLDHNIDFNIPNNENEFQFENTKNGLVIKKFIGHSEVVIIPTHSKKQQIIEIAKNAFSYNKNIKKIFVPKTIRKIENGAFSFSSVEFAFFEEGIQKIGDALGAFNVPGAFEGTPLKNVNIPKSVKIIGQKAFSGTLISEIIIPCAKEICYRAFFSCDKLQNVFFGKGVEYLSLNCFSKTRISTLILPETIKNFSSAFNDCPQLQDVYFEEGISEISGAFERCPSIKRFFFPSTIKTIDTYFCYADAYLTEKESWHGRYGWKPSFTPIENHNIIHYCLPSSLALDICIKRSYQYKIWNSLKVNLLNFNIFDRCIKTNTINKHFDKLKKVKNELILIENSIKNENLKIENLNKNKTTKIKSEIVLEKEKNKLKHLRRTFFLTFIFFIRKRKKIRKEIISQKDIVLKREYASIIDRKLYNEKNDKEINIHKYQLSKLNIKLNKLKKEFDDIRLFRK